LTLILCEKPSVAKEFAKVLGCRQEKGYYQNEEYLITYCFGHLFELYNPDDYDPKYKKWKTDDLPIIPEIFKYKKQSSAKEQTECVLRLLKQNKNGKILVATDAGREGELIARITLEQAGIDTRTGCKRFWVSEALTEEVIKVGIAAAKPLSIYDMVARQGYARQRADWMVGINLTRYMSIGNTELFSVGRVQTALLNVIAVRNYNVANFVPTPYYELEIVLKDKGNNSIKALLINPETNNTPFMVEKGYIAEALRYAKENVKAECSIETKQRKEKPEKLLNITGLQKKAYKKYGYSPEYTLSVAQKLYEEYKCLSYPRTPSRVMGDNNVELFREKFILLNNKYNDISKYCDNKLIMKDNTHIFNSKELEDHHALIPLADIPEKANEAEKNIFNIVVNSFFTVCMPDCIIKENKLLVQNGIYKYRAGYRVIIDAGWRKSIARNQKEAEEDEEQLVSSFDEKNCFITSGDILRKETQPKKEYSIDTLLSLMENPRDEKTEGKLYGIGTPATRAEIIKTLFERNYIEENKKKLYATKKGNYLLAELKKDEDLKRITDIKETTEWEIRLNENPDEFIKKVEEYVRKCIKPISRNSFEITVGKCPRCGGIIKESKKAYYCVNKECDFYIFREIAGATVNSGDALLLITGKTTGMKQCVSKAGKKFSAKFKLDKENKIEFIFGKKQGSGQRKQVSAAKKA
jgi:DNA topoisomerase-3